MSVTYYVALPFVKTEDGVAAGEAQEMPNEGAAILRAESMSRDPANGGALASNAAATRTSVVSPTPQFLKRSVRCRRTWTNYDHLFRLRPRTWRRNIP
jgi:hypothetical protein